MNIINKLFFFSPPYDKKEGKCNPDLFFLLLQKDIREYIEKHISIPEKYKKQGFEKVIVDFYMGSTGNIGIDSVCIIMQAELAQGIMFSIKKDGTYRNNRLNNEDFEFIINIPMTIDDNGTYFIQKLKK